MPAGGGVLFGGGRGRAGSEQSELDPRDWSRPSSPGGEGVSAGKKSKRRTSLSSVQSFVPWRKKVGFVLLPVSLLIAAVMVVKLFCTPEYAHNFSFVGWPPRLTVGADSDLIIVSD